MLSSLEEYESSGSEDGWVDLFMKKFTSPILVRVHQTYIEDSFNLFGLSDQVKDFPRALEALRGGYTVGFSKREEVLYYLIHQRYILSKYGMEEIHTVICRGVYGKCRRVSCKGFPLLPVGLSDFAGYSNAKLFCHQCTEIYESAGELSKIDGCAFGRTFPHLFILMYRELFPKCKISTKYTPKIFGFRIDTEHE